MIASLCLWSCALTLGQATDRAEWQLAPQLTPGLELVYQGSYLEEALSPHVQRQQQYRLETNLLVLDAKGKEWQVALLTALSMQDPGRPFAKQTEGPVSVRLEMASIDFQGKIRTPDKKPLLIPLKGPLTLEHGFLPASPLIKAGRNFMWEVAEAGRPVQHWQIAGTEACNGITCIKITGWQQSDDWDQLRADQTAWRRRDTLWLLPQLNVAQKVERITEWRDPARAQPTRRTVVRYELESRTKYPDSLFNDRRQELFKAKKFYEDAEALSRQPALYRPQIEALLQRVSTYLARSATTHYRKVFTHLKIVLESAKKGESLVPHTVEEPVSHEVQALIIGQRAPDFVVSSLTEEQPARLYDHQGKPVLIFFYNPATTIGKEVIRYAKQLSEQHAGDLAIMAMAVTNDPVQARKQHQELRLTFPLLDGNGMRLTFGADQTPRLVLLDGNGYVCLAQTGWGYQTPYEIQEELQRCRKKTP